MGEAAKPLSFLKVIKQVLMLFCVGGVVLCDIPTCLITCRKYGGSLAQNARFAAPTCLVSSLWFPSGVAVSMGEAAKPCLVSKFCFSCVYVGSCKASLVLLGPRRLVYGGSCKTSVSAFPLASQCLWGKLQNIARFAALTSPCLCGKLQNLSLCLSSGVAVSMGEAAKYRSFCCGHCAVSIRKLQNLSLCFLSGVAVSLGEAAKPQSLLFLWHRRVYGGTCKTSLVCSTK